MAEAFIQKVISNDRGHGGLLVSASPYAYIPTASWYMKNHFVRRVNRYLAANDLPVLEELKISRSVTYREDYGEMTADERLHLISGDRFYIDKNLVKGKTLLLIDDIRGVLKIDFSASSQNGSLWPALRSGFFSGLLGKNSPGQVDYRGNSPEKDGFLDVFDMKINFY